MAKFDDHLPLYRQAEIYARDGVDLATSTLSGWLGATAATLRPLVDLLHREMIAGSAVLHGDDTPIPVLAPGTGKTRTGRLWTYVRDERPHGGTRPPAAVFFASPDRRGERPLAHLAGFSGVLVADGYAGFNGLYEKARPGGPLTEAACWAHVRRKIFDVHAATGSALAAEALARIGALYGIERELHGKPPDARTRERQARAKPLAAALKVWAERSLASYRVGPNWPRRCATCWPVGRRSSAPSTTDASRSTTTRPSGHCAVWRSGARIISSPAPTSVPRARPSSTP